MLCCCAKNRATSYTVEESAKTAQAPQTTVTDGKQEKPPSASIQEQPTPSITTDTKIITGKGALSTSNPNLAAGEANLDKTTISAAKREKSPVTEQPISSREATGQQSQPSSDKENSAPTNGPVAAESISVINVAKSNLPPQSIESIEKAVESSSHKAVAACPSPSLASTTTLESLNSSLDKLEKDLSEVESKKSCAEKVEAVPGLADQLKVLTSQVLGAAKKTGVGPGMGDQALGAAVSRLEAVAARLEALAGGSASTAAGDSDAVSPFVVAYDGIISGPLAEYLTLSNNIGGDVKTQAAIVKDAFDAQRSFLVVASKSKKPTDAGLMEVLKPSATKLQAVQEFRENNRRSDLFNHLSALSESIAALGWVTVSPTPGPFVREMVDAGTFYTNRVLKDFKDKDARHVQWTKAWIAVLTELQAYIKQYHTTGLTWNPKGGDAKAVSSGGAAAAPPPSGGAPPPPPPPGPPPPPPPADNKVTGADDGARNALFAEISRGEQVTSGLRKVTDDMKTHKNPALRQGPAPFKASKPVKPVTSPKPAAASPAVADKPPVIELQGKKWVVEYHKNNKEILVENTEIKQTVYVYKCEGCVIQIKGKVNSIILDSCKKTAIVFDSVLASLEFVNCQSMQAQVTGKLPTVSIDKTDGCMVYLSSESIDAEIVTAKSSEMNILVPQADGDYKEFALPEQFKTKYDGTTMVTTMTESI